MSGDARVYPLPRGRHRLSRAEVLASQRGRMIEAMAAAVGETGFARASVASVIKRAGVSRETFYQHFADKEECFLAAFDTGVEVLLDAMGTAYEEAADDDPIARFERALGAYLHVLSVEPALARTFLVEVYAAGERALARRLVLQQRFVDTLAEMLGAKSPEELFDCEALVAAVSSLVTARVTSGRTDDLSSLQAPIVGFVRRHQHAVVRARGRRAS